MSTPTPKGQQMGPKARNRYPALWAALEGVSTRIAVAKGKVLFQQGEAGRGVFLLREGKVRLSLHAAGRKKLPYRIAGPGNILGFPATISNAPYSLTAENLADCELGFAPAEDVINLLSKRSDLCFQAVEIMAHEVKKLRKRQAALLYLPVNSAKQL
ncbi:MAG: cyclic nucleotide-binding domain-containing protein [Acidobacteriia bacterium]|nr:cyclic nucleotide-binding domain-containing protein [Terriglobia bacterium]